MPSSRFRPSSILAIDPPLVSPGILLDIYQYDPGPSSFHEFPVALKMPRALPTTPVTVLTQQLSLVKDVFRDFHSDIAPLEDIPNVVPMWMVNTKPFPDQSYAVASRWCANGNVLKYTQHHPTVNRLPLVIQAARGLNQLHRRGFIHGNICPNNILIDDELEASISDVGLDAQIRRTFYPMNLDLDIRAAWAYKSREELSPTDDDFPPTYTKSSDVYSFATTVYAIYTSRPPFPPHALSQGLFEISIHGHTNVKQPPEIPDNLWKILKSCWNLNMLECPTMAEVVDNLENLGFST